MQKWYSYIVRENLYGIAIQAVGLVTGLISAIVLPNIMGKADFGYFSLAIAMATGLLLFADTGIGQVTLKMIPEGEKTGRAKAYYDYLLRRKAFLSAAVAILLFLLSDFIASAFFSMPAAAEGFRVASAILFIWSFTTYFEVVLFALKGTAEVLVTTSIFQIARIILPVLFYLYLFPGQWAWALFGVVLASLLYLVILSIGVKRRMPKKEKGGPLDENILKRYWLYSFLSYVGITLFMNFDVLVVGLSQGPEQVSAYKVALMWVTSVTAIGLSANRILFSAHARETEERSRAIVSRAVRYAFSASFFMITGLVLLSGKLLTLVYSGKYAESYPLLAILSLLVLESILNGITSSVMLGRGKVELQTKLSLATGLLQLVVMLIVTPLYGIAGTAVAVVCIRLVFSLIALRYALSMLSLGVQVRSLAVPILSSVLITALLMPHVPNVHDFVGVIILGAAAAFAYSLIIFALRIVTIREIADLVRSSNLI